MTEILLTLWKNATYRHLLLSYMVASFFGNGMLQWQPAFFIRSFGMSTGQVGTGLAMTMGAGSLLSIYAGGALASRYAGNNERLQFKVAALGYLLIGVDHALAYLSPSAYLALVLLGLAALAYAVSGPLFAAIQTLVPAEMRGTAYAILSMFSSLIGLGLGPLAAGMLSDVLHPLLGREALRYALLAMCPGYAWSAWQIWRASSTVMHDIAAVQADRLLQPNPDGG